jgi:SAM-dependent methyltransferase
MDVMRLAKYALAGWTPGGKFHCVMCDHRIWRFMPYMGGSANSPPLMRALNVVGSNPDQFECPRCGAHDRERHLLMYLRATGLLESIRDKSVLHFAPEKRLARLIAAGKPSNYICCDLYPSAPEIQRVDMLDMQFSAESFDVVIANHVLEHDSEDSKALREICRVLAPGGYAILQTPYSARLHNTWQDSGIDDDDSRLEAYGQKDHVRLFGRDIFDRFASAGLASCVRQHDELLLDIDAVTTGVNIAEPFFLFQKP